MNTLIESGVTDSGIHWETHMDEDYEIEKNFWIIASRGTGRYLKVDETCDSMDEFDAALKSDTIVYYQPLFMLAHSGVSVSLGGYNDPWDSGQCGFACITRDDATEWNILPHEYEEFLTSQVKNFDAGLRGEVFRFEMYLKNKCNECGCDSVETLDGCGGFVYPDGYTAFYKNEILPSIEWAEKKLAEAEHQAEKGVKSDD